MTEEERKKFRDFIRKSAAQVGTWPDWKRNCMGELNSPPIEEAAEQLALLYQNEKWFIGCGHDGETIIMWTKCVVANMMTTYWVYPLRIEVLDEYDEFKPLRG